MAKKPKSDDVQPEQAADSTVKPEDQAIATVPSQQSTDLDTDLSFDPTSWRDIDEASASNVGIGEVQVSRLGIAQSLTPEVASNVEGWRSGILFDTIAREPLSLFGQPPWLLDKGITDCKPRSYLPFLPILKMPSEFCKWPDKGERESGIKKFHWKSLDQSEQRVREGMWPPIGNWKGTGSPPVTQHLNIVGICVNMEGDMISTPIIASFSRTSFKAGRKLVTAIVNHRMQRLPNWGRVYYLYTDPQKLPNGFTTNVMDFAKGRKISEVFEPDVFKALHEFCYSIAVPLANKETGYDLQCSYLNAATFSEEEGAEGEGGDDSSDPSF